MTTPLDTLRDSPQEVNPALLMAWNLKDRERKGEIGVRELLPMAAEIEAARYDGEAEVRATERSLKLLRGAIPIPLTATVPEGF